MIAEDKISVADYAQRAIKEKEQVTDAAKLLEEWAHQDAELKAALLEPLLKQACYQAVTRACRVFRRKVWTAPNYTKSGNGQRVVALANSLMDFPLPGGVRLRDATKKQIEEAAGYYGRQARQMAVITAWLQRIYSRLDHGSPVAEQLTEEQLVALREQVEK